MYTLSGTGSLSAAYEQVGGGGTAIFNQTGGTNAINGGELDIGAGVGSAGIYTLSAGTLTVSGSAYVGGSAGGAGGAGTLTVSNTALFYVAGTLTIYKSGQVNINGGSVSAAVLDVIGSYTQSGGNATFGQTTDSGTITLTGGKLILPVNGNFSQAGNVSLSGTSILQVGQPLSISGLTLNNGVLLFPTSGDGVINVQNVANLTAGALGFFASVAPASSNYTLLTAGTLNNSLVLAPATFGRLTFTPSVDGNSIVVNVTGCPASLLWNNSAGGDGQTWDIQGNENWTSNSAIGNPSQFYALDNTLFNDANNGNYNVHIASAGVQPSSVTVNTTGTYTFSGGPVNGGTGGLTVSGGTLALQNANAWSGAVTVDGGTLTLSGAGSLSANNEVAGQAGTGIINQSGGTNTTYELDLGANSGSNGTYALSGNASLSATYEYIGRGGTGTFNQSGGTNTIGGSLYVNSNGNSTSTYNLGGTGLLSAPLEEIGYGHTGSFNQSGGVNASSGLQLGSFTGSTGTYALSGGSLSANSEQIGGGSGTGIFNQTGGTNTTSDFELGQDGGSSGTYTLSGTGSLSVIGGDIEYVGLGGTGTFNQTSGTNTTFGLQLGLAGGSTGIYTLSGTGSLSAQFETIGVSGVGNFNQSGGTNILTSDSNLGIGFFTGSTGTYTLSGGALSVAFGSEVVGSAGTGAFNQSGGSNTIGSSGYGGQLKIGALSGSTGTYTITGGTLTVIGSTLLGGSSSGPGGTGTLTVSNSGIVTTGSLTTFNTPNTSINVNGGSLTAAAFINNAAYIQTAGNASLGAISGTGSITLSGGQTTAISININSLSLSNSGLFQLLLTGIDAPASTLNSLTFAGSNNIWSGVLDLTNNKLIIEPTAAVKAAVIAALQNQIATHAITSSTLPPNEGIALFDNALLHLTTFANQPVDANSILLSPELLGDANADGHLDLSDLSTILNNFGATTSAWTSGNFDGASTIDLTDLSDVLNNFGATNPTPTVTPTPEPTALALLLPAALLLHNRQKRKA